MGSGGTPIKFGPEWLRNLGEGTTQSGAPSSGSGASESTSGTAGTGRNNLQTTGSPLPGSTTAQNLRQNNTSRIHLANLRYGREEMLALYDRLVAAPESIKQFELLYQQRGKPPCALNVFKDGQNTPEEGASGGQIGGTSLSSYSGRGRGNGVGTAYTKKPSTVRPNVTNMGRVWNKVRTDPAQGGSVPPDTQELRRSWNASNAAGTSRQATTEQSGWASTKLFKNRRQIRSTNWRQSGREEGGEWRSQDHAARFPNAERDWPERSPQDRPQSWSANRRPWSEHQNDEIPEWANDNADAGAGTFDSSGAFHGCSDEVRPQEQTFPLPRYQASSNLMRSSSDEAAEQWWSSEKAKKLSPKRLISGGAQGQASTSNDASQDTPPTNNEQLEVRMPEPKPENDVKPKPFDALLRRDIDVGNENNNLSNFQSVMISQNNTLRQKHQNIVSSPTTGTNNQSRNSFPIFQGKYEQMKQITAEQGNGNQENLFEGPLPDNMPIKNPTPNMPRAPSEDTSVLAPGQQGGPPNLQLQTGGAVAGIEAQSIPSATKIPNPVQNSIPPLGLQNSASGTTLNMQSNDLMMPPLHGLPQMMSSTAFNPGMSMPSLQQRSNMMDAFQQNVRSHIMTSSNAPSASVPYLGQNNAMMASNRQPNPEMAACMFPPQGIPRHAAQPPPLNSVYGGPSMLSEAQNFLADLWYYEDPEKKIQGPFSSKEMWNWYIAGYFQPSLIVRRAFETTMRPLADYGPMPFLKVGMNSQVNCPRAPDTINPQAGFGLGETSRVWSPAPHSQNIIWMEPTLYPESSVNNLPRYFWDVEPPAMPSIVPKEMKTEDEILAQILSSQNISLPRAPSSEEIVKPVPLSNVHSMNANNVFVKPPNVPDLSQLPVIRPEMIPRYSPPTVDIKQQLEELAAKQVPLEADAESPKASSPKEVKTPKLNKNESEKCKNKEANGKSKSKKPKEEKKDDNGTTTDDDATKQLGKRSVESSPSKTSKEVKVPNKKDLEKEKKELMKDGFTIVKGAEKNNNKEIKKKVEEAKAAEEAARKKKEEDAMLEADESRKLSLAAVIKKQDQQKQAAEFVAKKAPWSAVATQATATDKGALTLAVIQRLEREKKLEQIKEQQQMMQIIAQQQAATLAREQEVQAGLGWATKKNATPTTPPNLAEIQSKTRRQQAAATPVASEFPDEKSQAPPAVVNHVPWGTSSNGGFWDSPSQSKQNADPVKSEPSKPVETKSKSKTPVPAPAPSKKKATPAMEFDSWCTQALGLWTSKIDVPTFMVFLKDIESPYEVKDYVKCYLGESKESSDFSRQFLERRSKLLRVGTVTPSDDLCSPALAINPRNNSTSDYQEVKGKGKKTKKNKMMKVDARILGFSVTAAEDRINVGDIDTA